MGCQQRGTRPLAGIPDPQRLFNSRVWTCAGPLGDRPWQHRHLQHCLQRRTRWRIDGERLLLQPQSSRRKLPHERGCVVKGEIIRPGTDDSHAIREPAGNPLLILVGERRRVNRPGA
jgi:hypothetical protein